MQTDYIKKLVRRGAIMLPAGCKVQVNERTCTASIQYPDGEVVTMNLFSFSRMVA